MVFYRFQKGEHFESKVYSKNDKENLDSLSKNKFKDYEELSKLIGSSHAYISKDFSTFKEFTNQRVTRIPFLIRELPVFYHRQNLNQLENHHIGKVIIVD